MTTEQTNQFIQYIDESLANDTGEQVIISKLCADIYQNYNDMPKSTYMDMLISIANNNSNNTLARLYATLMKHYEFLKLTMISNNTQDRNIILSMMQSIHNKIDLISN